MDTDFPDPKLRNPADVLKLLTAVAGKLMRGELETKVGNAVSFVASTASAVMARQAEATHPRVEFIVTPPATSEIPRDEFAEEYQRQRDAKKDNGTLVK